jgi:hypothetical protein
MLPSGVLLTGEHAASCAFKFKSLSLNPSPAREIQLERNADRDSLEAILRVARLREVSGLIGTQPVVEATDFSQNGGH